LKDIIIQAQNGEKYLVITNPDEKKWIVPFDYAKRGLEIYQPSSSKGKMLKKYISFIKLFPRLINRLGIKINFYCFDPGFEYIIKNLFDKKELIYSIFCGTPGKDSKPTIQIFTSKKILAYCKYSSNKNICELFKREADSLKYLANKGVSSVPQLLLLEKIEDEVLFIQSTSKRFGAKTLHNISELHMDFLLDLSQKTCKNCAFHETEYYKMLQEFKSNYDKMPFIYDKEMLNDAIMIIEKRMGNEKEYSFYHGDFTPWNTYLTKKRSIEAFDLEYSKYSYPKLLDIFHFYTQVCIYEKEMDSDNIIKTFEKYFIKGKFSGYFDNAFFSYLLYLVDIINMYLIRDYGVYSEETVKCIKIRYELLNYCVGKCKDGTIYE
jgi:hypothetical protein